MVNMNVVNSSKYRMGIEDINSSQPRNSNVSILQDYLAPRIFNMSTPAIQNNATPFVDFDVLQFTRQLNILKHQLTNRQSEAFDYIVSIVIIVLAIGGTIGNIMCMAVFRMYQKLSKSSATFLMQALCLVDTCCLLCSVPLECDVILRSRIKR